MSIQGNLHSGVTADLHGHLFSISYTLVYSYTTKTKQKQTPWPLVRERTIPTERPPLVDEI
jgi:hypothetical protein